MRRLLVVLLVLLSFQGLAKGPKYIFFLHNKYLELAPLDAPHDEYGKCEYREIIAAFEKEGFTVISEIRKKDTDGDKYALKVKGQVDSLIKKGAKPSDITIIGTSKGGYIAWKASAFMKNKDVNFVLIGICSEALLNESLGDDICGNVLSIYEQTDVLGRSCAPFKSRTRHPLPHYREIELNTGMKHGFLYKALPAWMAPATKWAKGNYELK